MFLIGAYWYKIAQLQDLTIHLQITYIQIITVSLVISSKLILLHSHECDSLLYIFHLYSLLANILLRDPFTFVVEEFNYILKTKLPKEWSSEWERALFLVKIQIIKGRKQS